MDFFDCYKDFLAYIDAKGHSPNTVSTDWSDSNTFRRFLNENGLSPLLSDIDHKVLRRYTVWLKSKAYGTNSIKKKLDSMGSLFNYVVAEDLVLKNPMLKVDRIKEQPITRTFLTEEEVKRLLYVVDHWSTVSKIRNQAFFRIFLYTGLRVTEICSINWEDINFHDNTITIRKAKGNKSRLVYMNEELSEYLWAYLQVRLPLNNGALFLNRKQNRLHRKGANGIIRQYCKKAAIPKHVTAHVMRHTFATLLIQKGVDIITVQQLLDHNDVSTTQIYAHTSAGRMKDALGKLKLD